MNITTCFLALIVLAAVIFIHNLFLLRRIDRLRHGQRVWKALSEANYHEAEELEGMLHRSRSREVLLKRMLNRCREKQEWLITQIWGSPTIVRDLPDVYKIICELRDRLAASERTSKGLATVVERQDAEKREISAQVEQWMAQARSNAELVTTLMEQGWAITEDAIPAGHAKRFLVFDAKLKDLPQIGDGETPEEAIADAATKTGLI